MARNAETHRVIHGTHRNRLLRHISMARRAIHSRPNMWRMIELHVRRGLKPVNTLPRDVLSLRLIRRDLLDFSIVGINRRMARRAYGDAWNRGVWPLVHADVAERTLQPARQMNLVCKGNRLDNFRMNVEKFSNCVRRGAVGRRIHAGIFRRNGRWRRRLRVR